MKPIGFLLNTKDGLSRDAGLYYDYILAANGLFIRAESPSIKATVCVGSAEVRGLLPIQEKVELTHGKIPRYLYDLTFSVLLDKQEHERYLAVTWQEEYRLRYPHQIGGAGSVKYEVIQDTLLDIHSHGGMGAFFSGTDDKDEQGLKLSMVFGKLDAEPEYDLRIGVYGYYARLSFEEVFE
jgi:PRTRC genetic system protein A